MEVELLWSQVPPVSEVNSWIQLIAFLAVLGFQAYGMWAAHHRGQKTDTAINETKNAAISAAETSKKNAVAVADVHDAMNGGMAAAKAKIADLEGVIIELRKELAVAAAHTT